MKIAVIGTGYVGLVTGTCFAETGNEVTCIDIDQDKIFRLNAGEITIYEPTLDVLFKRNVEQGRLKFTSNLKDGINQAMVIFLALPTPQDEDGAADLSYVLSASQSIAPLLTGYTVIVDKSTVPVGTAKLVYSTIMELVDPNYVTIDVVSNPEFLREGSAVEDFLKPDRVVIGTDSDQAFKIMEQLYAPMIRQGNPLYRMDVESAEMTKYAANAFLAMKISYMNEIANVCQRVGANVDQVRLGIGSDHRIGKNFLFPGIGYGGSCFPKDVSALRKISEDVGYDFKILKSVVKVNNAQKEKFADMIIERFKDESIKPTIAVWGLAFKPNTDDVRDAPSLTIIHKLTSNGFRIVAHDPEAVENFKRKMYAIRTNITYSTDIQYVDNMYDALDGASALLICTEWAQYRTPSYDQIVSRLKEPIIFDGRNVCNLEDVRGLEYYSIGRKNFKPDWKHRILATARKL